MVAYGYIHLHDGASSQTEAADTFSSQTRVVSTDTVLTRTDNTTQTISQ